MKWHFSPQLPDQVETEVTQRDQFNNDDVDISETLVREALQNSLDAAVDDPSEVEVHFRWVKHCDGLDAGFFSSLFDGHLPHARAAEISFDDLDFDQPDALVVEDFGTCGLTGSISQKDVGHFSDFWRRHGKSHKMGKSRGRWGLGKLVYSTTSRIGVFFGITCREGEEKLHLMGQTVLNLRKVDGKEYPPHAFFADVENPDDIYSRIPVPVKDMDLVDSFIKNFQLSRKMKPGLSIIIPFPDPSFNLERMIGVAIENYFYPLITGQLVLRFDDININGSNVRELTKTYAADRFGQIDLLFDFIEEIYLAEQGEALELKSSWIDDQKLSENDFEPETLDIMRERFGNGELVALYLPVVVKRKGGNDQESGFTVYIKRPEELKRGKDLYVRGGLTLPAEAKFGERRALGAMIAEDGAICDFLGDAENAAHTQWTTNTEKLRKKYRNSQPLVTVIKKSVQQLYDLLAEVIEESDEDALLDFFWFDEPETGKKKKRKRPQPPGPIPPIQAPKPKFTLNQIKGGFTLSSTENFKEEDLPREVRVTVAYEVSRGSPFKRYDPLDFTVGRGGAISVTACDGVEVVSAKENKWVVKITKLPFTFSTSGFDENRDLKIRYE